MCQADHVPLVLTFCPATEEDVRAFLLWRYEKPYDIYNLLPDGEIHQQDIESMVRYLLGPACACHSIFDTQGNLCGFCTFGPDGQVPGGDYGSDALDIGLGLHPDWTGRSFGIAFVTAVLDFATQSFAPAALRVTIAEFNERALRVWQKAGFTPLQRFIFAENKRAFVVLARPVSQSLANDSQQIPT